MGVPTGNVFQTDAPTGDDTYWRLYHGGGQYFNLYKESGNTQINLNAQQGNLLFRTNDIQRMRMNPTVSYAVGSFASAPRNGFVGIGGRPGFFTGNGPFTRLHLVDDVGADNPSVYEQAVAYRPWMRNGITFTGNSDQAYIGQKVTSDDVTDLVIQWSDNAGSGGQFSPDRLRFLFTTTYTGAASGFNSLEGLEAMRMWPNSPSSVYIGLGDYAVAGSGEPTERLDILTGRVRIRQLPTDAAANTLTKVMVVDNTGLVKWRDATTLTADDCEWTLQGLPGSNSDVSTAYAANPGCPQQDKGVGIGVQIPKAKLHVRKDLYTALQEESAIKAETVRSDEGNTSYGVDASNTDAAPNITYNYAVRGRAMNGRLNYGVFGQATTESWQAANCFGVYGIATAANTSSVYGVYGTASNTNNNGGVGSAWAGYFQGDVMINGNGYLTGMIPIASDANLKTNVQDIQDAGALLAQLQPKTYDFLTAEHPDLRLPTGPQMGLIAQEVEAVLPELVKQVTVAAPLDSTGAEQGQSETIKTLNYMGLIPLLIAGYQEQEARISELEQRLNDCCAAPGDERQAPSGSPAGSAFVGEALRIAPNPFTDRTTLTYTVPNAGKVRLEVGTQDGRRVDVLREEKAQAGTFTYEWNTQGLAASTYLCTLLLDGKVVVKKAVKVDH